MKLYFMKQDVLGDLKGNKKNYIDKYNQKDNNWLYEIYGEPFLEYRIDVNDFELEYEDINTGKTDVQNTKILHSNLKAVTRTEASDERFWAGLTHGVFWEYMYLRWGKSGNKREIDLDNRYFLKSGVGIKRALMVNTLSKLWWAGELAYVEDARDPYFLLETLESDYVTKMYTLFSSNFASNKKILHAVLKALLNYEKNFNKLERSQYRKLIRRVNILGGGYLLDYLSEEELVEKFIGIIKNDLINNN